MNEESTAKRRQGARARLSRPVLIATGVAIADRDGLEALTIRALANELGSKPMSIYRHVDSKEDLLDGMVDLVIAEMEAADADPDWKAAILRRCRSARAALIRHPWAIPLLESRRNPGPELLRHHEATLAALARGGLSLESMARAYALIDSVVYGFAIQEVNLDVRGREQTSEVSEEVAFELDPGEFPHLMRFAAEHAMRPDYSFGEAFDPGVLMLLDAIERSDRAAP